MSVIYEGQHKKETIAEGRTRYLAHSENLMMVVFTFEDGPATAPDTPHQHPHEQITYVAEGKLIFFIDDTPYTLEKGDVIVVPPNTDHTIQTLTSYVRLIDTFHPLREDFLKADK